MELSEETKSKFSALVEKAKKFFGEEEANEIVLMAEARLEDGSIIGTQADAFEAGVDVFLVEDGETMPLEPGSYMTEDGYTLVVEEAGVVASYEQAPAEEEEMAEEESEVEELRQAFQLVYGFIENLMQELEAEPKAEEEQEELSEETSETEAAEDQSAEVELSEEEKPEPGADPIVLSKEKKTLEPLEKGFNSASQESRAQMILNRYRN